MFRCSSFLILINIFFLLYLIDSGQAQETIPRLYEELYKVSFTKTGTNYCSLLDKSVPLSAWTGLHHELTSKEISMLVDRSIEPNWLTFFLSCTIADSYNNFLRNAEWGRKKFSDEAEKGEYDKSVAKLFEFSGEKGWLPKEDYKCYLNLLDEDNKLKSAHDATPEDKRTAEQRAKLTRAKRKLETDGQQYIFESYVKDLKMFLNYDYAKSIATHLLKLFKENQSEDNVPNTYFSPKIKPFEHENYWKSVSAEIPIKEVVPHPYGYPNKNLPIGFWFETPEGIKNIESPELITINAEVSVISIRRPWFDIQGEIAGISTHGKWRWHNENGQLLSSGKITPSLNNPSPLTFLPKAIVLLRNFSIQANWNYSLLKEIESAKKLGLKVRFGPLAIAGNFSSPFGDVEIYPFPGKDKTIIVPGMQLIAFHSELLPLCPEPDNNLIWGEPLPDFPIVP